MRFFETLELCFPICSCCCCCLYSIKEWDEANKTVNESGALDCLFFYGNHLPKNKVCGWWRFHDNLNIFYVWAVIQRTYYKILWEPIVDSAKYFYSKIFLLLFYYYIIDQVQIDKSELDAWVCIDNFIQLYIWTQCITT